MSKVARLIRKLVGGASALIQREMLLKKLNAENPTCKIKSTNFTAVSIGEYVVILDNVSLRQVRLDHCSYLDSNSMLKNVKIGKYCSVGPGARIGLWRHPSQTFISTYPAFYSDDNPSCQIRLRENKIFDESVPETVIENDVWIGANVIIPGGIRIGNGAIVAAGSVVVKDVPPYAMIGGNPARIIRYRFSEEEIATLLASEWWNWPIDKLRKYVDYFSDFERFKTILK